MMEAEETLVSVRDLSKRYCRDLRRSLWYGVRDVARELRGRGGHAAARDGEFWALQNVSFELKRGESLAIIGANGAGKSTLLKVLTGLIKPDSGEARLRGRVGSIIELGTGFNPILTGRENITIYAAICGFTRREIEPILEQIVDFAELADALEAPVQFYSSGMQARLAFAVTAFLKPDVLLIDEALAVGDINFQRKCVIRMLTYLEEGGALILVSHSPYQIQSTCRRGLLLERGRVTFEGNATETLGRYFESRLAATQTAEAIAPKTLTQEQPVAVVAVRVEGENSGELRTGEAAWVRISYLALDSIEVFWGFSIWTGDGWICVTGDYDLREQKLKAGTGELICQIPRLPLLTGVYLLKAAIIEPVSMQVLAASGWEDAPTTLKVKTPHALRSNLCLGMNQEMTIDVEWQ